MESNNTGPTDPTNVQSEPLKELSPDPEASTQESVHKNLVNGKANSSRKVILILLPIALLLLAAMGVWYAVNSSKSVQNGTDTSNLNESVLANSSTSELLVDELSMLIKGDQIEVRTITEDGGRDQDGRTGYSVATYQPNGHTFAVYPKEHKGLMANGTPEVARNDLASIKTFLKNNGFNPLSSTQDDIYVSEEAVCSVDLFEMEIDNKDGVSVACGDISSYHANYQELLPFYDSYIRSGKAENEAADIAVISSLDIKSGLEEYKSATVAFGNTIGGFTGLFYMTPESDNWVYFTGGHNLPPCDAYNTEDLKKAFYGENCYDSATGNIVQVKS